MPRRRRKPWRTAPPGTQQPESLHPWQPWPGRGPTSQRHHGLLAADADRFNEIAGHRATAHAVPKSDIAGSGGTSLRTMSRFSNRQHSTKLEDAEMPPTRPARRCVLSHNSASVARTRNIRLSIPQRARATNSRSRSKTSFLVLGSAPVSHTAITLTLGVRHSHAQRKHVIQRLCIQPDSEI